MGVRSEQWTVRRRRYYGVCEGELDKGSLLKEGDWKIKLRGEEGSLLSERELHKKLRVGEGN